MSEHPNVTVVNRMTKAVFEKDRETLVDLFTDDLTFRVRVPSRAQATIRASTVSSVPSARSSNSPAEM